MFGFRLTPVVKRLLLINVVIFIITALLGAGGAFNKQPVVIEWFGMHDILSPAFKPWQPITYMFLHGSFFHLFGNMFGLLIFGPWLEHVWGAKKFLVFYFVVGLGAMALYGTIQFFEMRQLEDAAERFYQEPTASNLNKFVQKHASNIYQKRGYIELREKYAEKPDNEALEEQALQMVHTVEQRTLNRPMIGASGAVLGIVMAFSLLFPNTELMLLFPPIPIKAKYIALIYAAFDIYGIVVDAPSDNVAHYAHIGGLLFGWLMVVIYNQDRNNFY